MGDSEGVVGPRRREAVDRVGRDHRDLRDGNGPSGGMTGRDGAADADADADVARSSLARGERVDKGARHRRDAPPQVDGDGPPGRSCCSESVAQLGFSGGVRGRGTVMNVTAWIASPGFIRGDGDYCDGLVGPSSCRRRRPTAAPRKKIAAETED